MKTRDYLAWLAHQLDRHTDPDELVRAITDGLGHIDTELDREHPEVKLLAWDLMRCRWVVLNGGTPHQPDVDRVVHETLRALRPYGALSAWETVRTWQGPQ